MPSLSLLHACRVSRSLRPQSASCSILALRSPYACFYLILAILNYFNLSSVFILNYHAFYSLLYFNFFCLILTDAAPTCLECPRGRVAVYRERKKERASVSWVAKRYGTGSRLSQHLTFQSGGCINLSICMWSGCHQADTVVSHTYPG